MRTPTVSMWAFIGLLLTGVAAQTPAPSPEGEYLFIDGKTARSFFPGTVDLRKIRERLVDAGSRGYGLRSIARSRGSVNMLLKRDGQGTRTYRLIAEQGEGRFMKELNAAGSEGFEVVADTVKAFDDRAQTTWVAVMARQSDATRFEYSVVKGNDESERALAEPTAASMLKGVVGRVGMSSAKTLLFFERQEPPTEAATPTERREYRIVATARTSALQKDLGNAAAERFRVVAVAAGYVAAVIARDSSPTAEPVDYRVIAMIRQPTAVKELNEAGAEGYRIAAMSENGSEAVFILHRKPDQPQRFEYRMLELEEATADRALRDAEAEGYRTATLLNELVVLERP